MFAINSIVFYSKEIFGMYMQLLIKQSLLLLLLNVAMLSGTLQGHTSMAMSGILHWICTGCPFSPVLLLPGTRISLL